MFRSKPTAWNGRCWLPCAKKKRRDGPRRCCRPCYRCWPKPCREIRTRRQGGPRLELHGLLVRWYFPANMALLEIPCQAMDGKKASQWENRWPKWSIVHCHVWLPKGKPNAINLPFGDGWGPTISHSFLVKLEVLYMLGLSYVAGLVFKGKLIWAKIWIASWSSIHCIGMCKTKLLLLERRIAPATCATWI